MSTTLIILYAACGVIVLQLAWIIMTELRLKKVFRGKGAEDLEGMLKDVAEGISKLEQANKEITRLLNEHDGRIKTSIRGVELTRFNPFQEAGSNQSFAIALMNEEGDGLVLSSLYSRDRMSIFAKPVKKGTSDFELTTEEKGVIQKATR